MLGLGFAKSYRRHLGQTNAANFSGPYQITQSAYAFLDGHSFIPAVQVIQVNHIRVEATQTVVAGGLDGFGSAINHSHFFTVTVDINPLHTAFAGQDEATAVFGQNLADDAFALTKAIKGCGIEKIHTLVQSS